MKDLAILPARVIRHLEEHVGLQLRYGDERYLVEINLPQYCSWMAERRVWCKSLHTYHSDVNVCRHRVLENQGSSTIIRNSFPYHNVWSRSGMSMTNAAFQQTFIRSPSNSCTSITSPKTETILICEHHRVPFCPPVGSCATPLKTHLTVGRNEQQMHTTCHRMPRTKATLKQTIDNCSRGDCSLNLCCWCRSFR